MLSVFGRRYHFALFEETVEALDIVVADTSCNILNSKSRLIAKQLFGMLNSDCVHCFQELAQNFL